MFGIAGTVELGTICPGTGTWNRLQDGSISDRILPRFFENFAHNVKIREFQSKLATCSESKTSEKSSNPEV